ncbi:MAG: DUF4339 domain-containing protein, partial [Planctomycetia bacterium]|nr:DUF4339 domain-containing protein [Planctomycetia bacterium]
MPTALDRWYLTQGGCQYGPFTTTELFDALSVGKVAPSEWVWPEGVDVGITVQQFLERVHAETLPGWMEAPPMPYVEGWYHIRPQQPCGPFAKETLLELAVRGELRPDDVIWRHNASGWSSFAAKQVIAYPPPGSPWPSWLKETARAEKVKLSTTAAKRPSNSAPLTAATSAQPPTALPDWMDELKKAALPAQPASAALPDWMKETRLDAATAKKLPSPQSVAPPGCPTPDWVADIRTIEQSLRRQFILTLAQPAKAPTPTVTAAPQRSTPMPLSLPAATASKLATSSWPLSQDYNEAIQTPTQCFSDPELRQGTAITNALGLPIPCAGNFADVYAVQTPRRKLAVKCFTRQIPGLRERYVEISQYLKQVQLPFMVEFQFLDQGIKVRGQWYPVLKMQWVEGVPLNNYVQDQLNSPQTLRALCRMWLKLAGRLQQASLAHGDLQHGNVLLTPATKAETFRVHLVDYDGMCVPALDLLKPIEVGHSAYQHPQRQREGTY